MDNAKNLRAHFVLRNATIVALECVVLQAERRSSPDARAISVANSHLEIIRQNSEFYEFDQISTWIKSLRKQWLDEDKKKK